jgi:hypothetical protein
MYVHAPDNASTQLSGFFSTFTCTAPVDFSALQAAASLFTF